MRIPCKEITMKKREKMEGRGGEEAGGKTFWFPFIKTLRDGWRRTEKHPSKYKIIYLSLISFLPVKRDEHSRMFIAERPLPISSSYQNLWTFLLFLRPNNDRSRRSLLTWAFLSSELAQDLKKDNLTKINFTGTNFSNCGELCKKSTSTLMNPCHSRYSVNRFYFRIGDENSISLQLENNLKILCRSFLSWFRFLNLIYEPLLIPLPK